MNVLRKRRLRKAVQILKADVEQRLALATAPAQRVKARS